MSTTDQSPGAPRTTLRFHERYVVPILAGEKTATVRYDLDGAHVGDELTALTADGTKFATLHVTRRATGNAIEARSLLDAFGANHGAGTPEALLEGLNEHYDAGIQPSTTVTVVVFEVVEP